MTIWGRRSRSKKRAQPATSRAARERTGMQTQMCSKFPHYPGDTLEAPQNDQGDPEVARARVLSRGDYEPRGEIDTECSRPGELEQEAV